MGFLNILLNTFFIIAILSLCSYFLRIYYFKHINREGLKIKKPPNILGFLSKLIPAIKCSIKIGSNINTCAFNYMMDSLFTLLFLLCMLGFCLLINVNFLMWGLAFFLMVFVKQYFFYAFDFILWGFGYNNIFVRSKSQLTKCYCLGFIKTMFLPVTSGNLLSKSLNNPYVFGMLFTIFGGMFYIIYKYYKK